MLSGIAWQLTHTRPELIVPKVVSDAETKPKDIVEPFSTVVRTSCEKVAPLRKREAFNNFVRKGTRTHGEDFQDFIARREMECEKLAQLSPSKTIS